MAVILISGGTGLIGSHLSTFLVKRGYQVVILTRNKEKISDNPGITYSYWNVKEKIIDREVVRNADHIIHLAGAGVMDKKWTNEYKDVILESRTKSAELIINCLKEIEHHVKTFVSASAIGWYGEDDKLARKEGFIESDPASNDFLGKTCILWEAASSPVTALGIRGVILRTGIVLASKGGAFESYKTPLKFGIAPILGSGKQVISWIHIEDLCRMYGEAIENNELNGTYNAVASETVTQKDLVVELGQKMRNKFFIPVYVPGFGLKLVFGQRSIEILKSATVSNKKIKATGFTFLFPSVESAIDNLARDIKK